MSASIDVATRGTRAAAAVPLRNRLRSARVWILSAVVVLLAVVATTLMTSDRQPSDPLHYDSTARDGMKALVETLRTQGIQVTTTEDQETARRAAAGAGTTLLIPVGAQLLGPGDVDGLTSALSAEGNRLVLVDPGFAVSAFTDRISVDATIDPLGQPDAVSSPDCSVPAARAAGTVSTGESRYTAAEPGDDRVQICYPFSGPGITVDSSAPAGQLVIDDGGQVPVTVLGNPAWLSNSEIDEEGNAALVLSTLSAEDSLVVYYPRPDDTVQPPPSTLDYVPSWFIAGTLWLVPCLIVGLFVIGRRFGPLAVERLPVVVPAVETVHGRAALAARSRDRTGALRTLRTAALLRIGRRLALGPAAREEEILARIAVTTGRDPTQIAWAFRTAAPADDGELTAVVDLISTIESEIP